MLIAAVLCLCAAVATAALGVWLLTRPPVRRLRPAGAARGRADPAGRRRHARRGRGGGAVGQARRCRRSCSSCASSARSARSRPAAGRAPRPSCATSSGKRRDAPAAAAAARARRARCPAASFQLRLTSIGWVASSDSGSGWRRSTRAHRSTRGSTRTSDGNADNTIQSSRSISPSSWPIVQPE